MDTMIYITSNSLHGKVYMATQQKSPPISEIINQANYCQQQKFDLDEIKIKNVTMNVTKSLGEL